MCITYPLGYRQSCYVEWLEVCRLAARDMKCISSAVKAPVLRCAYIMYRCVHAETVAGRGWLCCGCTSPMYTHATSACVQISSGEIISSCSAWQYNPLVLTFLYIIQHKFNWLFIIELYSLIPLLCVLFESYVVVSHFYDQV